MKDLSKKVAAIALGTSLLFTSVTGASAATYTVKSGDSLSKIAKKYNTTYTKIMSQNGLKSTSIKAGQKLQIGGSASSTTSKSTSTTTSSASSSTYTVKSGDSLSKIAKLFGTTSSSIMKLNGLSSSKIKIGQKLKVKGIASASTSTTTSKTTAVTGTKVVSLAKNYLGTRYVFGGSSPLGFDCSGFVYYVFKKAGKSISRTTAYSYYAKAKKVSSPQVGDLVFFSNTYQKGISHVGIYVGNGQMISASGTKVNITTFKSGYWKTHFTSYGRL